MSRIGFHASHEQFAPSHLLRLVQQAEAAGFAAAKSSDHFHPWSERQGQSGFAWSWIGAALQATRFPIGLISAPGYRYHPAIIAQAAATLGEMFPGRVWLALGSGEAINEAILGQHWPEKAERNARLQECALLIRALLAGETVTHRGRITLVEARLYSRPATPVPLFGAAVSPETAALVAGWADGLLTVGGDFDSVARVVTAFRNAGGEGKPIHIQHALAWDETDDAALAGAMDQWAPAIVGGEVAWDLRRPADFDQVAQLVTPQALRKRIDISSDLGWHRDRIAALAALADTVHLHCVTRNQEAFIDTFGARVLPQLRDPAATAAH
ncbi:TIGR03885 family FMN-dependent LLM class oxidoreductase [Tabrizicola aquatica]|uniref:TIGR03885 family FMN-dependent LLM class oxidoreductase n=1 Tax=Tabrizicola aquatica TaxID=909926 RepID=UPI000CD24AEC|nr:TIGR03885 family FMN-dependent LLM class oxidoreductase [Tabrizicola aquatica]